MAAAPGTTEQRADAVAGTAQEAEARAILDDAWRIVDPGAAEGHVELTIPDVGPEAVARRARAARALLARIAEVDPASLPMPLSLDLAAAAAMAERWDVDDDDYWLTFDPMGIGFPSMFAPSAYSGGFLLGSVHETLTRASIDGDADVARHVRLLADYGRLVRQLADRTAGQAERGIVMPARQLATAIPLVQALQQAGRAVLDGVVERSRASLSEASLAQIEERTVAEVDAAFAAVLAVLEAPDYAARAPERVGLGQFPGGHDAYERTVRIHTTQDLSAQEVHDRGLARMARILGEMRELMSSQGFDGTPQEYLERLADDPAWRAHDAEGIAAHFQRAIDRIEPELAAHFGRLPSAPYAVDAVPDAVAGSMTFGYYAAPQPDREVGVYLFNARHLAKAALPHIAALTYHELMPGHHLDIAGKQESTGRHALGQHLSLSAFSEGWAEYAARYAGEIGMYVEPEERFGRLMMDAFLTSRLVVDTGMNALGWELERARDYMREHAFLGEAEIASETLRYSCDIPGQALAYKLGDDFFFDLREELRAALGDGFDVRAFHEAVLAAAGLPLPFVAEHVRRELAA
ncbi:DUF885 domain-containing protein [Agrococcus sp. Marseille-P2731]|uniref:DUF885 domain-containing protein n=1 Tax=Agrococcus sp. Marseille-P2731 TaxID=1841862 RepID=UPI0009314FCB|nr:DUF885 domain-containing protein [Agrococcus sp. Marseille-P2731]